MAIRKVEAPKVAKQQTISPVEAEAADPLPALKAQVDRALLDGNFSQKETRDLEDALKANPRAKGDVAAHLTAELEKRIADGKPVQISEVALSKLGQTLGLELKELFFRRQATSTTTDRAVNQGLNKTAKTVADEHSGDAHKAASDTRLQQQKAIRDSHSGVVDRPIGGSKGASYDAVGILAEHFEGKLDGKLGVEAKAAKDVLREPLVKAGVQIANEIKKGDTLKKVTDAASQVNQPGFKEALGSAASSVGADIVNATNMTAVNVDAVNAVVNGTQGLVTSLSNATKGTKLESIVAQNAPKLLKGVTDLGAKVTSGAKVASAATTAVETAATAAKVAQGATVAAEGVQVATAGAKVAGQSVPVLGQALGVVTTGLATAELIGHCRQSPRDWKRIFSNAANVIGQAVGIFIPFVGAATTAGKLASDAAMNAHDKKVGKETANVGIGDIAPHVHNATSLLSPFLDGAGYSDAATKLRGYNAQVGHLAEKGMSSAEIANLDAAEREAMMQSLAAAGKEMEGVAHEAKGTPNEAAALLFGQAFTKLVGAWSKSKNVKSAEDPEAASKKVAGEAMEAASMATTAKAMSDAQPS